MDAVAGSAARTRYDALKAEVRGAVEDFLSTSIARYPDSPVREVARYAACGGGHRWRAIASVASGLIFRSDALTLCLPGGSGVELAHAASMLLDDLPSMDDARYRRGKLCAHLVYPAWAVDMAPVFMLTMAYHVSLANRHTTHERRVKAGIMLSTAGQAMIAGQSNDLAATADDEARLIARYRQKTGALYAAATSSGGVVSGASDDETATLHSVGMNLGLACQFLDDVADVDATLEEVGKEPGSDAGKTTAIDLYGVDGARRRAGEFQELADSALATFGDPAEPLRLLVSEASWKAF